MNSQLVLATHNKHKAEELRSMLAGFGVQVLTLDDFPQVGDIVEDADTLEGNAMKKAREVFNITHLPALADDTGLEVKFLNGQPGVYSARFAGENATYADNVKKLLTALEGVPMVQRRARFRSVLAFVADEGVEQLAEGICQGVITEGVRGTNGFGYDPIFLPDGYSQTFAEMSLDLKNTLSHRAKALERMRTILQDYF